jgi:hypothetical protein
MTLLVFLFEGGKDHMESDRSFFEKPERVIDWMSMVLSQRRDRRKEEHVPIINQVLEKRINPSFRSFGGDKNNLKGTFWFLKRQQAHHTVAPLFLSWRQGRRQRLPSRQRPRYFRQPHAIIPNFFLQNKKNIAGVHIDF